VQDAVLKWRRGQGPAQPGDLEDAAGQLVAPKREREDVRLLATHAESSSREAHA
jgi:hypothetical protein